ncbi:hypothetical protein GCM10022222_51310 [Amycolatopsis ultiminotia]|uniref:DUF4185 domain-containing protein n=1 Tax=Amycolatopsis ultiminotia TaxID=543629 RepID=A0ABP6X4C7_9PSEU
MTTPSPIEALLARSRGPAGQPRPVEFDTATGPLAELGAVLSRCNGFFAFNAGVQVFRAGEPGDGPEIQAWNSTDLWKDTYQGLADGLFCFGQDLFGTQYAIEDRRRVVTFDPETGTRTPLGDSLEDWAAWLLADPDVHGCYGFATAWQDTHGPLHHDQRLIPWQFFTLGGTYEPANLTAKPADACMRIRGPIARNLHTLDTGTHITMTPEPSEHDRIAYAELDVFADYNSFLVQDENARINPGPAWTDALIHDLIATAPGAIGIGTVRAMTVPVTVEVRTTEPAGQDPDTWDHITEAGLHTNTGRLLVSMFDHRPEIPRIQVPPGDYAARIHYRGFDTLTPDGLDGHDSYHIVLWPSPPRAAHVLKRYPHPIPGG